MCIILPWWIHYVVEKWMHGIPLCSNMFKKHAILVSIYFVVHWPCFNDFLLSLSLSLFISKVTSCPTRICVIVIWPGWVSGWRRPGWSVETLAVRSQLSWRRSPSRMWPPQTSHATVSLSFSLHLLGYMFIVLFGLINIIGNNSGFS